MSVFLQWMLQIFIGFLLWVLQIFIARQSIYDSFINNVYPHICSITFTNSLQNNLSSYCYLTYISRTNNHREWMEEMEEHGYILRTKCIKKYSYRHTSFNYPLDHKHQSTLCYCEATLLWTPRGRSLCKASPSIDICGQNIVFKTSTQDTLTATSKEYKI